jgi:iron complex transport system ATP-binding protein
LSEVFLRITKEEPCGSFFFIVDAPRCKTIQSGVQRRGQRGRRGGSPVGVFILVGGNSARMGRDKSKLLLGSKTFLQRITETARQLDVPVEQIFEDAIPRCGPLSGIHTAFVRSRCGWGLFLSCDMPLVSADLLRALLRRAEETGGAVFTTDQGRAGFPFVLRRAARGVVMRQIRAGELSLQQLKRGVDAEEFRPPAKLREQLLNVNTATDYARAVRAWEKQWKSDAVLEVRNLVIRRGQNPLVKNFSWKVRRREHWVVLGPNGCGKTSLFSALLGYLSPTAGDIFVLGEEYGNSDWPELRKRVGLVSSSLRQMMADTEPAWITVAGGKYAMIDFWGTPKKADRIAALRLLREAEVEYLADRPWAVLSQGERQRVLIARALMPRPALLILDEPCAGLDPAAREHFLDFLERLGGKPNAPSLVLVTHHVEEIMPVFTHALVMKAGAKVAEGGFSKILKSRVLSAAFDTPMELRKINGRYSLRVKGNPGVMI